MSKVLRINDDPKETYIFTCPGCKQSHTFRIPPWTFNGDMQKPTVGGSILVNGHLLSSPPMEPGVFRCHSLIRDGMIQFLADCTHELAGQTVEMQDI